MGMDEKAENTPPMETLPTPGVLPVLRGLWRFLTLRIKLPAWAVILWMVIWQIPDWKEHIEFYLAAAKAVGGHMGQIAGIISSQWFAPSLVIPAIIWILFVGEPKKGVLRHPRWVVIGWIAVGLCATAVVVTLLYGAVQIAVETEVGAKDHQIQMQAAVRPVYWHLTDIQKFGLEVELNKLSDKEKFPIQIQCLPDAGSRTFVDDFGKPFQDKKWPIKANCLFSNVKPDLTGLWISVSSSLAGKPKSTVPKNAMKFMAILKEAKIPFQIGEEKIPKDQWRVVIGNAP